MKPNTEKQKKDNPAGKITLVQRGASVRIEFSLTLKKG